jgi:hypothetical protein
MKIDSQPNPGIAKTVTSKRSRLCWCLILSLIAHGLALCIVIVVPRHGMRSSLVVTAVLAPSPPEETAAEKPKTVDEKAKRPIASTTAIPRAQNADRRAFRETQPSLLSDSPPSSREVSSSPAEATVLNQEAFGPGGTASESGGIDIGAAGGSPSGKRTTAGRAGPLLVVLLWRDPARDSMIQLAIEGRREPDLEAEFLSPPCPRLL